MVQQQTGAGSECTTIYSTGCPNMLPCGVCRLLLMNCPKNINDININWGLPITPTCVDKEESINEFTV